MQSRCPRPRPVFKLSNHWYNAVTTERSSALEKIGMSEFSRCEKCGQETTDQVAYCPQCKGPMVSSVSVRRRGWGLAIIGSLLAVFMAFIIIWEVRAMLPGSDTYFTGTRRDAAIAFTLEGDVLLFGLFALWTGVSQIKSGKRNLTLNYLTVGLALIAVMICIAFTIGRAQN